MKKVNFNFSLLFNNLVFISQKGNLVRVCSSVGFDTMKCSNKKIVLKRRNPIKGQTQLQVLEKSNTSRTAVFSKKWGLMGINDH